MLWEVDFVIVRPALYPHPFYEIVDLVVCSAVVIWCCFWAPAYHHHHWIASGWVPSPIQLDFSLIWWADQRVAAPALEYRFLFTLASYLIEQRFIHGLVLEVLRRALLSWEILVLIHSIQPLPISQPEISRHLSILNLNIPLSLRVIKQRLKPHLVSKTIECIVGEDTDFIVTD